MPVGVARERARGVGELGARRLDGARERRERLVDGGGRVEIGRDARELIAHRVLALVEAIGGALRRVLELLGVAEARALALELRLLAGRRVELLDLLELEREEVLALGAVALGLAHAGDLADHVRELRDLLAERVAHRVELAERVEVLEVRRRIGEAHALVLRGDVAEVRRELGELRGRRDLAVQERAAPSLGLHDAPDDELAVARNAGSLELGGDARARLDLEERGHLGLAFARRARPRGRARPPRTSASASTTIDLPAPVSPVRTLKPGPSSRTWCSMRTTLSMVSEWSMRRGVGYPKHGARSRA